MNCTLLTKEELIRGERIFKQLKRVKEEKASLKDYLILSIAVQTITKEDWKHLNIVGKVALLSIYSPFLYILYDFLYRHL